MKFMVKRLPYGEKAAIYHLFKTYATFTSLKRFVL